MLVEITWGKIYGAVRQGTCRRYIRHICKQLANLDEKEKREPGCCFFKANLLPFIGYSILHTKQHPFIEVTPVNPGNKIFQSILTNEKAEFVWAKLSL